MREVKLTVVTCSMIPVINLEKAKLKWQKGISSCCQGVEQEGGMNRESIQNWQGSETSLYDITLIDTCH